MWLLLPPQKPAEKLAFIDWILVSGRFPAASIKGNPSPICFAKLVESCMDIGRHQEMDQYHFHIHIIFIHSTITSMEYAGLRRQAAYMRKGLFDQGYLDEQFYQLEDLQDDVTPNFVEEVVTLFFKDSSRLLSSIMQDLEKSSPDFQKLDAHMHQFKGSISSIGALKVKNECILLGEYCNNKNLDGCLKAIHKVKKEYAILKLKLEAYFQLLRQIGPAEGATRSVQ